MLPLLPDLFVIVFDYLKQNDVLLLFQTGLFEPPLWNRIINQTSIRVVYDGSQLVMGEIQAFQFNKSNVFQIQGKQKANDENLKKTLAKMKSLKSLFATNIVDKENGFDWKEFQHVEDLDIVEPGLGG